MKRQGEKTNESWEDYSRIANDLYRSLDLHGYKSRVVSITRLKELREDIYERNHTGQFAPELFDERFKAFDFNVNTENTEARSIVIVAAPQPHIRLGINLGERRLSVIIPPTYSIRIDGTVEQVLKGILEPHGYKIFRRSMPLKLLAVRSGLARYGRNNLAYVDGMGSYCRLLGFYTSLPISESTWIDPQPLKECEKCVACLKKCPSNAISRDRFLIRAERCLTFHNEREVDFPAGLLREWHHCLVGCLYCQTYCPINKKVKGWIEECGTLDAHDTAVLLDGGPPEALSKSGRGILDEFGFAEELPELSRNLKALLDPPANMERVGKLLPRTFDGKQDNAK